MIADFFRNDYWYTSRYCFCVKCFQYISNSCTLYYQQNQGTNISTENLDLRSLYYLLNKNSTSDENKIWLYNRLDYWKRQ